MKVIFGAEKLETKTGAFIIALFNYFYDLGEVSIQSVTTTRVDTQNEKVEIVLTTKTTKYIFYSRNAINMVVASFDHQTYSK